MMPFSRLPMRPEGHPKSTAEKRDGINHWPSAIVAVCKALMGTAAATAGQGANRGRCEPGSRAADQITPKPPEERQPGAAARPGYAK